MPILSGLRSPKVRYVYLTLIVLITPRFLWFYIIVTDEMDPTLGTAKTDATMVTSSPSSVRLLLQLVKYEVFPLSEPPKKPYNYTA